MVEQHVVSDEAFVFLLVFKVRAGIGRDPSVPERQLQVQILQFVQIYLAYVEGTFGPRKLWRSEDLTYRNIHIRHTILKDRLLFRIVPGPELHLHISPVIPCPFDTHIRSLIEGVDKLLLNLLIQPVIQIVDFHNFPRKIIFEIFPDLGNGPGNNRKTPLIPRNIPVRQLSGLTVIEDAQLLLLLIKLQRLPAALWQEGPLSKDLHNSRTRMDCGQLLILS